jgi:hypothetical protein
MPRSTDRPTRATRDAANVAAAAVVAYAVLWFLSTQVAAIRAFSPFGDDPWDAVATYAAIFLPFVAGPTWIRSLRHRQPVLPAATASRIRWGSGLAAGIVLIAAGIAAQAILTIGFPADAGPEAWLMGGLVVASIALAVTAIALAVRAASISGRGPIRDDTDEPDIVDDLLGLAGEIATAIGLGRQGQHLATAIEGFLDGSPISPRRHRWLFGAVLALAAAIGFDVWHAFREGPWANLFAPLAFGVLLAAGVLAAYLGTVIPLRLLRPQRDRPGGTTSGI